MNAYTNDELVSPVSAQALADWLRLDDTSDPLLASMVLSATQCVIDYIQRDLMPRDWQVTYHDWPKSRQGRQLHYGWPGYQDGVELPYAQLISVDTVTVYGELLTADEYTVINELPAKVRFKTITQQSNQPAVVVTYRAGFDSVPQAIKTAITMIAAFMHAHRGACEASQAITLSGAATLLHPYRVRAGIAL